MKDSDDQPRKDGPWTTLSSDTVLDTPWIRVDHHDVINPGGEETNYSTIHFKNLAIGIVPLDSENRIHLVGQYRYPVKEYSWEIPEGGGNRSVPPIDSAKRELEEETGITAYRWDLIMYCHLSNSATDEETYIYLARDLEYGIANPDTDEELETKSVSIDEFFAMVNSGEIKDSLTIMAAQKLELMKLKGEL